MKRETEIRTQIERECKTEVSGITKQNVKVKQKREAKLKK